MKLLAIYVYFCFYLPGQIILTTPDKATAFVLFIIYKIDQHTVRIQCTNSYKYYDTIKMQCFSFFVTLGFGFVE